MWDGFVGLLDLKKDASIGVDGQSILLRTNDFLGISGMERNCFHLISVRSQPNSTIATGFIVLGDDSSPGTAVPLVRKYNPQTEEVSSQEVDSQTTRNLLDQIQMGQVPAGRILNYSDIVSHPQRQLWKAQTSFILDSGILPKRGLHHGAKVIPGSFTEDDDHSTKPWAKSTIRPDDNSSDGISVLYPSIPVMDASLSLRTHQHVGMRRHLATLSPAERTKLFMEPQVAGRLLRDVLSLHFDNDWKTLLGDLQLAHVLFLYLQCLSSLEHWKELVAMLSLVDPSTMQAFPNLYQSFMEILLSQLASIDKEFLEDMDDAGNNFLVPSLKHLCRNLTRAAAGTSILVQDDSMLQFQRLLSNKFPSMLEINSDDEDGNDGNDNDNAHLRRGGDSSSDDDSDGPVVVDMEDIQASLARSSESQLHNVAVTSVPLGVVEKYPLLVAAIQPHEDILMTCARALDEKRDVSLVREAAAYLEEIEQRKL